MDPEANLSELRELYRKYLDHGQVLSPSEGERLAELLEAMHAWVEGGGFLPDDWSRRTRTPPSASVDYPEIVRLCELELYGGGLDSVERATLARKAQRLDLSLSAGGPLPVEWGRGA